MKGCFDPFITVPLLPILVETATSLHHKDKHTKIKEHMVGMFSIITGLATSFGFLYGINMTDLVGLRYTCDITGAVSLIFGISFYLYIKLRES